MKEWKTEPNSRMSTTSTSISPVDMAVAKPANTSPMTSASPVSWMRVPAGISFTAGNSHTAARPSPSSLPAAMSAPMTTRRSRLKRAIEDGPCPKRIAATDESGTLAPAGVGTGSSPITAMSLRAASSSCTRIGIWRSPTVNFARLASTSPMVAMRRVSATAAVEIPSSARRARSGSTMTSGRSRAAFEAIARNLPVAAIWLWILRACSSSTAPSVPMTPKASARSPRSLTK